jgi:hypothetical protein
MRWNAASRQRAVLAWAASSTASLRQFEVFPFQLIELVFWHRPISKRHWGGGQLGTDLAQRSPISGTPESVDRGDNLVVAGVWMDRDLQAADRRLPPVPFHIAP